MMSAAAPNATLLAAASALSGAVVDLVEAARHGQINRNDNVATGETLLQIADGARLFIEALDGKTVADRADTDQLHAALLKWIDEQTGMTVHAGIPVGEEPAEPAPAPAPAPEPSS